MYLLDRRFAHHQAEKRPSGPGHSAIACTVARGGPPPRRARVDPDESASPGDGEGIIAAFRSGVRAAGFEHPEWTPYWLRHSFITHNLDILSDREIETLAGHTSAVTNAIYRHPSDEVVLERAGKIQRKLEKKWEREP